MSSKDGMKNTRNEMPKDPRPSEVARKPTLAEKMAIAEELRDLQKALAPIREANRKRVAEQGKMKEEANEIATRSQLS